MRADKWQAADYSRHSSLQEAMADEVLAMLDLEGHEHVLDVGCGDGRLTARVSDRVPSGMVVGVDASPDMIAYAAAHFGDAGQEPRANLQFEVADARSLHYPGEFDLGISFNALHWVPEQGAALRGIAAALKPDGRAVLRLVVKGTVRSLEEVAEATRKAPRWAPRFDGFVDPYLRLDAGQYAALAQQHGLRVLTQRTDLKSWDFKTHEAFFGFCRAGFGAWTNRLDESERDAYIADVITAYPTVFGGTAAEANLFRFYQMDIGVARMG